MSDNFYDYNVDTNNSKTTNYEFDTSADALERRRQIRSRLQAEGAANRTAGTSQRRTAPAPQRTAGTTSNNVRRSTVAGATSVSGNANVNRAVNTRTRAYARSEMDEWAREELDEFDAISRRKSSGQTRQARPAGAQARTANGQVRPAGAQTRTANGQARPAGAQTRQARPAGAQTRTVNGQARPVNAQARQGRPAGAEGYRRTGAPAPTEAERRAAAARRNSAVAAGARRTAGNGSRPAGREDIRRAGGRPPKNEKKKFGLFWKCFVAYAALLVLAGIIFLIYTESCLKKYEASQADNAITGFVEEFRKDLADGTAASSIDLSATSTPFESSDVVLNSWLASVGTPAKLTAELDSNSYDTQAPVYDIYDGEKMIAKMTLKATNPKVIFGLLKITDWQVESISPVGEITLNSYKITIPTTCTATINGVTVDETYKTQSNIVDTKFQYVAEYVTIPGTDVYEVSGLVNAPEIKVLKEDGTEVTGTVDENGNVSVDVTAVFEGGEIPEDLKTTALKIAQDWEDFITRDLAGNSAYGLDTIQAELIKDSYYYQLAHDYATGPDISMISDHTCLDPKFSNIVVDSYAKYTDTCFSCRIEFDKNMYLTRTGENQVEHVDSTFFFVYYDDSDDGTDNPHWAMVDMIATTE